MLSRIPRYTLSPQGIPVFSEPAWGRLRQIHGWTNGLSTDLLNVLLRKHRPAPSMTPATSKTLDVQISPAESKRIAGQLRNTGNVVLPFKLDSSKCDELVSFCLSLPCEPYPKPASSPPEVFLDLENPVAPMNMFTTRQGLDRHPVIAALKGDPVLLAIASEYLGCEPIVISSLIWASPPFGDGPSSEAAQMFHFDMAHPHFMKFFVYLTDVDEANGPHCVVPGTHRRDLKGWKYRLKMGDRIQDEDIERDYPKITQEVTGPKGTIFAEDTRAFHKGKHPRSGVRFVLEVYIANAIVEYSA